jgi:hypothetical protein
MGNIVRESAYWLMSSFFCLWFSFFCFFASFFSVEEGGGEGIGVISRDWSEIRQPRFHRLNLGHIAVTGDQDDGHVCPFHRNLLLQLEAIKAGKRDCQESGT